MNGDPSRGTWEGFWSDIITVHLILAAIILLDGGFAAYRRWRGGGTFFQISDYLPRLKLILIYIPFILFVVAWENIFGSFGYALREDDGYFLALLGGLAILAFLLVRWAKRQT